LLEISKHIRATTERFGRPTPAGLAVGLLLLTKVALAAVDRFLTMRHVSPRKMPWPPGLPSGPPVSDVRDATSSEHRAAEELVGPACRAADLVPIRSTVAKISADQIHLRDRNWRPSPSGQYLIVLIIGRRWEHASSGR
jgi:hypothetical protein